MELAGTIQEMRQVRANWRGDGVTVGFVPTMGALHDGHLSLVRKSQKTCDRTVVSIFLNALQFAPTEDLSSYPRDIEGDIAQLSELGVDAVFFPDKSEMYPSTFSTRVDQDETTAFLCGASRPMFFQGVLTVVLKLFNIVEPGHAFFGQKDAQQAAVVRRMIQDLNLPIEFHVVPIVREPDGLAMSSRNQYLSPEERVDAVCLIRSLQAARDAYAGGVRASEVLKNQAEEILNAVATARVDYVELVDPVTIQPVEVAKEGSLLALAVFIGKTRLIDNLILPRDPSLIS